MVALALGLGWWTVSHRTPGSEAVAAAACGPQRVPLSITASASVAPLVAQAAKAFDAGTASLVDGRCTHTRVVTADAMEFGDTLLAASESKGGAAAPTAWVPDGTVWREVLARRPELSALLPRAYPVVAVSPVVVAAAKPMAQALGWPGRQPSWDRLLGLAKDGRGWGAQGHPEWGRVRLLWRDPLRTAVALEATVSLTERVVADTESVDDVRRALLGAHSAMAGLDANPARDLAPLKAEAKGPGAALQNAPLVPMTEQEVIAFNDSRPKIPLAAMYPSDGVDPVQVPLITVRAPWVDDAQRAALDRFAEFLVTGQAARAFAQAGWRTPRLTPSPVAAEGAIASEPQYVPAAPAVSTVAQTMQRWSALDRPGSVLVVLDVSGSMRERVPAADNATRLDLAKASITASLPLFSDRTAVGLWTFSRHEGRTDHTVVLDPGPLSRTVGGVSARDRLQQAVARLQADGATGLYDTVIAAARTAQSHWRQGSNTIVLISDGRNEDPGSATLAQVRQQVAALKDPRRPVRILSIALGSKADTNALRQISQATGGQAYVARDAKDLDKVFLTALTD